MMSRRYAELTRLRRLRRLLRVHCFAALAHVNRLDCVEATPPGRPAASQGASRPEKVQLCPIHMGPNMGPPPTFGTFRQVALHSETKNAPKIGALSRAGDGI